jgi:hypothetical protein
MEVKVIENVYGLDLDKWFVMAKRINKKRSFLFVSKRLGKHLEVESHKILYGGMLLARRLNEVFVKEEEKFDWEKEEKDFVDSYILDTYENKKEMLFIGFAETATGLGQSVFDRFDNSLYFHTTREEVRGKKSLINFEEEHSHATSHRCYVDESYLNNELPIVLVDDEVTTGNTSLNIIKDIQAKFPRKEYVVVSILNWMNEEELQMYKDFEKDNNVKIHFVYLVKGEIDRLYKEDLGRNQVNIEEFTEEDFVVSNVQGFEKESGIYIKETGRFGMNSKTHKEWKKKISENLKNDSDKTLVVGNGEFMYVPILVSYYLGDKKIKTTTRSPIHVENTEDYIIKSGIKFPSMDGKEVDNYLYNINEEEYDKVLLCVEGNVVMARVGEFIGKLKTFGKVKEVKVLKF